MRQYSKFNFYSLNSFLVLPWLALIFLEISIKDVLIFSALFIPFLIYWDCIWYRIATEGKIVVASFVKQIKYNRGYFKILARITHDNEDIYIEFWTPWNPEEVPEVSLKVCFTEPMLCLLVDKINKN